MSRCMRCGFARYCTSGCQAADWHNHRSVCTELVNEIWDYFTYKEGHVVYYGPVDQFTFELTRHIGMTSKKVYITPKVDLSVPHKLR